MSSASPIGWLLDEVAVVAVAQDHESELGAAALATHAVLAGLPTVEADRSRVLSRLASLSASEDHVSLFRTEASDIFAAEYFGRNLVLHEGYRVLPSRESSQPVEQLRERLGPRLIATTPGVWLQWGDKAAFRRRVMDLLGEGAAPPGYTHVLHGDLGTSELANRMNQRGKTGKRVLKAPGVGGSGNLVVEAGRYVGDDEVAALFRESPTDVEAVVEDWLDWSESLCVSYLMYPGTMPRLVGVTRQVVDERRARFVGSSSRSSQTEADLASIVEFTSVLAAAMAESGVQGVVGVDVIVGTKDTWGAHGLALPSGGRLCVIECNPRLNRNHRVALLVERLARVWGLDSAGLDWFLRDTPRSAAALSDPCLPKAPTRDRRSRVDLIDGKRVMTLDVVAKGRVSIA